MFSFLPADVRARYGPLLRIGFGVVVVFTGFFILSKILWSLGGVMIAWGVVSWVIRRRGRRRDGLDGIPGR